MDLFVQLRGSSGSRYDFSHLRQRILAGLFEGDIVPDYYSIVENYGIEVAEELEAEGILPSQPQNDHLGLHNGIVLQSAVPDRRWNKRVNDVVQVPYVIDSDYFSSSQTVRIKSALRDLADRSKVVQFLPRKNEQSYILLNKENGCSSSVGRQGGKQILSLAGHCATSKGIIQHEFMHALGFYHEQSRSDRDEYIKINWQNIDEGKEHNFQKKSGLIRLGNKYDYGSVLHYKTDTFSSNGKDTITALKPLEGKVMGQRRQADSQDILDIRLLYQCMSGPRNFSQYNSKRCTDDCKCWEGESGCGRRNDYCQGSLICKNNLCVDGGSGGNSSGNGVSPTRSPTASGVVSGKRLKFLKHNGECVSVNQKWKNNVTSWNCYNGKNQKWVYNESSKKIKIMLNGNNLCLSWYYNEENDRNDVKVMKCNGTMRQKWYILETAKGSMLALRTHKGGCLSRDTNSRNVKIDAKCNFSRNQRFHFEAV